MGGLVPVSGQTDQSEQGCMVHLYRDTHTNDAPEGDSDDVLGDLECIEVFRDLEGDNSVL